MTLWNPLEDYLKLAMVIILNGIVFLHGLFSWSSEEIKLYIYTICFSCESTLNMTTAYIYTSVPRKV